MPKISWNNNGNKEYPQNGCEFAPLIVAGKSATCQINLPKLSCVEEKHFEIFTKNGDWYVRNLSRERIACMKKIWFLQKNEEIKLAKENWILIGKYGSKSCVLIDYKNEEFEEELEAQTIEVKQTLSLKDEFDLLRNRFFAEFAPEDVLNFIGNFFAREFSAIRNIFICQKVIRGNRIGMRQTKVLRICEKDKRYEPSKSLMLETLRKKSPQRVDLNEGDADVALSIVRNSVRKAFCFPLMLQGKIFGLIYCDTKDDHGLGDSDYFNITRLIDSGLAALLFPFVGKPIDEDKTTAPQEVEKKNVSALIDVILDERDNYFLYRKRGDTIKKFTRFESEELRAGDKIFVTFFAIEIPTLAEAIAKNKIKDYMNNFIEITVR